MENITMGFLKPNLKYTKDRRTLRQGMFLFPNRGELNFRAFNVFCYLKNTYSQYNSL